MKSITEIGSFACLNDGSEEFYEHVLKHLNVVAKAGKDYKGHIGLYYGLHDGLAFATDPPFENIPILSVEQVKELMSEKKEETWQEAIRRMRAAGEFDDKYSNSLTFVYAFQMGFEAARKQMQ